MKETKTLAELYQIAPRHKFGDISLVIENQGGKLRGKFIFHPIAADRTVLEKNLEIDELPLCFGMPPLLVDTDVVSDVVWDEHSRTLGDVIPKVEQDIQKFGDALGDLGKKLAQCAKCPVFERCYRIAEFNLQRKNTGLKLYGKWEV